MGSTRRKNTQRSFSCTEPVIFKMLSTGGTTTIAKQCSIVCSRNVAMSFSTWIIVDPQDMDAIGEPMCMTFSEVLIFRITWMVSTSSSKIMRLTPGALECMEGVTADSWPK